MCGAGGIWDISVPSPQFCCEPKIALKNKVLTKKKKRGRDGGREGKKSK